MKQCRICGVKIVTKNWYCSLKNEHNYMCIPCYKKKTYTYNQTKNGKKSSIKRQAKHRQTEKGKITQKRYEQSLKGKIARQRAKRKSEAKRRRNLGWIQMFENPFNESIKIDYHHVTDTYVVAIPKDLHRLYLGKFHREMTMEIVKQIYLGED